jgi:hypothetical protein
LRPVSKACFKIHRYPSLLPGKEDRGYQTGGNRPFPSVARTAGNSHQYEKGRLKATGLSSALIVNCISQIKPEPGFKFFLKYPDMFLDAPIMRAIMPAFKLLHIF